MYLEKPVAMNLNLKPFKKVIYCGMGGSGIPGSIFKEIFSEYNMEIVHDYILPKLDSDTLVILCSYSGNTHETLACAEQALKSDCQIVGITSGGKLLEIFKNKNFVQVKAGLMPRVAFPYQLSALFTVFGKDIRNVNFLPKNFVEERSAQIAQQIFGKIPVIYVSRFSSVATRIKQDFNENSKLPAHVFIFPELCHNELVGLQNEKFLKEQAFIFLRDNETGFLKRQIDFTKDFISKKTVVIDYEMQGSDIEKVLNTIYLFDAVTVQLALLQKIDPEEVRIIEELKKYINQ